jgi:hypothetical protein
MLVIASFEKGLQRPLLPELTLKNRTLRALYKLLRSPNTRSAGESEMSKITAIGAALLLIPLLASGQDDPSGKTLASTIDVFVFPTEGQDAGQQSQEEFECYEWASANVGADPFDLIEQQEADEELSDAEMAAAEQAGQAAGAGTVVRGAAAGAIIGEVSGGDAGESAAIGAAVGVVAKRRRSRAAEQQAVQQAEESQETREEATAGEIEDFKKAFSVCLEAKDYMVKY